MEYLLYSGLIIPLLGILYEDVRARTVHLFWFGLLLAACLAWATFYHEHWLLDWCANALFIGMQLGILTVYFSIRQGQLTNIFQSYLGSGDVVFVGIVSVLFEPLFFIQIWTYSLVIILVAALFYHWLKPNPQFTIPLAGGWSFLLIIYLIFTLCSTK